MFAKKHSFRSLFYHQVYVLLLLITFLALGSGQAFAQLLVAPTRVVFEGNERSAAVNLVNTGNEAASYRIRFERKRMLSGGGMEAVEKPVDGELFSDNFVRFAPRQVTLQPGQSQTVRLMLRRRPNMEDGEYRSHLLFQTIPNKDVAGGIEAFKRDSGNELSISLTPVFGVSIPVIVRQGRTSAEVGLTELKVLTPDDKQQPPTLSMRMERKGNASAFGDIAVYYRKPGAKEKDKGIVVGRVNNVAVYTPNAFRSVEFPLNQAPDVKLKKGELHAVFREKEDQGGKVLAEARLGLP